jgi:hypothetical protein
VKEEVIEIQDQEDALQPDMVHEEVGQTGKYVIEDCIMFVYRLSLVIYLINQANVLSL